MKVRLLFFLGILAITLFFSLRLGKETLFYLSLQKKSSASISQWETVDIRGGFGLRAEYTFWAQEKPCRGSYLFAPPYYLNEAAAFSALKNKAKEEWKVWYNPQHPSVSALEKSFPTGLFIRTLICYGVVIYFFILNKKLATA